MTKRYRLFDALFKYRMKSHSGSIVVTFIKPPTPWNWSILPTRDYETGFPLHKVEIHTIQIIGNNPGINSTDLAARMGVTKSAVSQTLKKLVKKGLIQKTHLLVEARESALELTDLGWKGFHAHERFHTQIYEAVRQHFGESFEIKLDTFSIAMMDLNNILTQYSQQSA